MNIKRIILSKAAELGIEQTLIKTYDSFTGRLGFEPDISIEDKIQNGTHVRQQSKSKILLPLFITGEQICLRTFLLGYAFQVSGYQPIIVYNINTLPESVADSESHANNITMAKNKYLFCWFSKRFPVNCVSIGDLLQEDWGMSKGLDISRDPNVPYKHCGVDISEPALATTRKDLRRYSIDLNREDHYQTYCKYIIRGMMIAESFQRLIDRYDIEAVLSWDVFYTRGRIPLEICHANGIKSYTHEDGYNRGEIGYGNMNSREPSWRYINQEIVNRFLEQPLSEKKQNQIEEIMNRRASSNPDYNNHTIGANLSIDVSAETTVGVFSHLLWDGALEPDNAIYPNFYDWLTDTIETGKNIDGAEFIIKAHPAESMRETNETLADWINKSYGELEDNFTFLPADTDVDTYKLISALDAGIVYSSTVGIEMALGGTPVLTGGYPPYSGFGITCDPDSKQAYRSKLKNIKEFDSTSVSIKRARRFAYLLFVSKQLEFPFLYKYLSENHITVRHDEVVRKLEPVVTQVLHDEEVLMQGFK